MGVKQTSSLIEDCNNGLNCPKSSNKSYLSLKDFLKRENERKNGVLLNYIDELRFGVNNMPSSIKRGKKGFIPATGRVVYDYKIQVNKGADIKV